MRWGFKAKQKQCKWYVETSLAFMWEMFYSSMTLCKSHYPCWENAIWRGIRMQHYLLQNNSFSHDQGVIPADWIFVFIIGTQWKKFKQEVRIAPLHSCSVKRRNSTHPLANKLNEIIFGDPFRRLPNVWPKTWWWTANHFICNCPTGSIICLFWANWPMTCWSCLISCPMRIHTDRRIDFPKSLTKRLTVCAKWKTADQLIRLAEYPYEFQNTESYMDRFV